MAPKLISTVIEDLFPQVRTPGRHVSSAIHTIMRRQHPDRFKDTPIDMTRAAIGNAIERAIGAALHRKYPGRYLALPELEFEDFFGNCDLVDTVDDAVVEIKCTWASTKRVHEDGIDGQWFWRYWAQGKAYAKMLGLTKVRLIILFIVGDWKSGPPCCFTWEEKFSQEEIDETWAMIKAYAKDEEGQNERTSSSRIQPKSKPKPANPDPSPSDPRPRSERGTFKSARGKLGR